ncbi:MAG: hypothetical protein IPM32_00905 [Ignavibacteriae bacterium]|nr:hypothetical protein [Ignavibacteriota bacterium]
MSERTAKLDLLSNYFITFLKLHPEIARSNYIIKLFVNSFYLIILGHLISKLI